MALTTVRSHDEAVQATVARSLRGRTIDVWGLLFQTALIVCLLIALLVLGVLIATVLGDGWGTYQVRGWDFIDAGVAPRPGNAGISQAIIGSFWIAVCVVLVAFPLGVGAALYLEEYAPRNRLTTLIELNIRNLAGVPSVVYGLLGLAIFVNALSGFSAAEGVARRTLAAAGITLAVLVLPIVVITTAEAIRAVPEALREGAYGAGATKWEVIRTVVMPYAAPGVLTGSLLSISRAVGEAAPLIVVGAVAQTSRGAGLDIGNVLDPSALSARFTAMPMVVSTWSKDPQEAFNVDLAAAAIIAMLVLVLLINSLAIVLRNRFEKKRSG